MPDDYTVACYYFPNYHVDPRNEAQHGPGWTEWELVKRAEPCFEGHRQPRVPAWGYEDESDPAVMAKKIDAASRHGIDAFIFDWYWYDDGPFLARGLEEGFLNAPNSDRLRFGIMWANHNWMDVHPAKRKCAAPLLYPGAVTPATFDAMTDHIVHQYFAHPSYWAIGGRPYFSVYELYRLIEGLGGVEATRVALERFREKTCAAGFPGLHLNAVVWGVRVLPSETAIADPAQMVAHLGFDSVTSYVWVHHVPLSDFPRTAYSHVLEESVAQWRQSQAQFGVPYHPNVTMGWDSSPRTVQSDVFDGSGYPFSATLDGNTPAAFKEALARARQFLEPRPASERILTINAWNEWTEGSYLEPDTLHGMAYLEAVRDVFATAR
ncbi:MAG: glycoside hydrolase family 99-like domain-containing protein [Candidatus Hydrogenedentes bacterium]|nr:glycoside hydrolase family 99-like domain-containing protein [Candidatus Hydrogenedentota bacterium]